MNKQFVYQPYNEIKYQINSVQPNINIIPPHIIPNSNNINTMHISNMGVNNNNSIPYNIHNNNINLNPSIPCSNNYIKTIQNYNCQPIQYN